MTDNLQILTTRTAYLAARDRLINSNAHGSMGFVPTMGNLHRGHLALLSRALQDHPLLTVSIFVNPTQFGPGEDFNRYPRTLEQDCTLLHSFAKEQRLKFPILLFAPQDPQEVYGPQGPRTLITQPELAPQLEGSVRPTHFQGVLTVVYHLLRMVQPTSAYFGKKDYQQLVMIRHLQQDLNLPTNIIGVETERNERGLALSSRNQYLSPEQLTQGLYLPETLRAASQLLKQFIASQVKTPHPLSPQDWLTQHFAAACSTFDYFEIRRQKDLSSYQTLHEINHHPDHAAVLLAAFKVGSTRLLDNLEMI